jgi:hydroxyethylthiazole kinase-like sugar kinase family protein
MQVFNFADKAEHLTRHFERIAYLNLNFGTANQARTVNRAVNKYFRLSHPYVTDAQLTNPYELRRQFSLSK